MALNIHWPCNSSSIAPLFSSASLDCPRSSRGIMPTNLAALVSNTNTIRGSLKPIQFSALIQSLRGRASGDESFDVVETQGQEPGVSNAETQSNGPSTHSLLQDEIFLREVSLAKDAEAVLSMIAEKSQGSGGIVSKEDCATIIISALAQNNADLPFSILDAMRSNLIQRRLDRELQDAHIRDSSIMCWSWAQPDVMTYTTLVRGLAASLRVSDAIQIIKDISRVGVPPVDELVSCSRCRYQYELMSGEIVNIESESTSMNIPVLERGLRFLRIMKQTLPAAVHSIVSRLTELTQAAEEEVWMLARMCQLENKIEVIGEPSYSARKSRVKRARESLDESLVSRLELIDSYAKIASMIEIEVEMDTDVLAAEAVTNAESIADQIERLLELEKLETQWRIQAEANDEVERLLRSTPVFPDSF